MNGNFVISSTFADSDPMDGYKKTDFFNPNLADAVDDTRSRTNNTIISNPLREWAYKIVHWEDTGRKLEGIIYNDNEIENFDDAQRGTIALIKKWINYALSFAAFIALLYLLYHGFLMLTAMGDENQYKKGFKGLKTAGIALAGMGLSWLIVSLILYILKQIV